MKKLFAAIMLSLLALQASDLNKEQEAETKKVNPSDKIQLFLLPVYHFASIGPKFPSHINQELLCISLGLQTKTEKDQKIAVRALLSGSTPLEYSKECNTYEFELPRVSALYYLTNPNRAARLYSSFGLGIKARFSFKRNEKIWNDVREEAIAYEVDMLKETVQFFGAFGFGVEYAKYVSVIGLEAFADLPLLNLNLPFFENGSHIPSFKISAYLGF